MTVKSGSGERGLERPRRDAAMYAAGAAMARFLAGFLMAAGRFALPGRALRHGDDGGVGDAARGGRARWRGRASAIS